MLRVRSVMTGLAGSPFYSNLYFAGELDTEAETAADGVHDIWDGVHESIKAGLTIEVDPFVAIVDQVTGEVTGGHLVDPPDPVVCIAAADVLPMMTQLQVNLNTATYIGGRNVKGRCYIPALTEAVNDTNGRPSIGIRGGVEDLFDGVIAGGAQLVVWSRKNGTQAYVSSNTCSTQWASLRSRRD
uniref:Uncharacterized protein n=1 Tax=uncultured prokaryote TaxID=198431 RepID=A0A0H5Q7S2_9ZZZZ|nr:hypothetical protein [uncultured prokaryote]